MRSFRPLRLEALEDRTAPAGLDLVGPLGAVPDTSVPPAVLVPPPAVTSTLATAPSSAFVGGLISPVGTTVTAVPPVDTTVTVALIDPIGTPVSP